MLDGYLTAYAARDAEVCAETYCTDGEIHSLFGPKVAGRAAIQALHVEWFSTSEKNKRLDILSADARDDLGYVLLRYAADTPEGSESGTSLNVLARDSAGQWQIRFTSLNPDFEDIDTQMETP